MLMREALIVRNIMTWVKVKEKRMLSRNSTKKKVRILKLYNALKVVQMIIQLGNDILRNLGVEEPIDDVAVFFR